MTAAGKELKRAVTALLDGNIGAPLFDGKVEGDINTYVLMSISSETSENDTFDMSVAEMNLDFDIVNVRPATVKSEVVEQIDSSIRELINPTKNTEGFTLSSPFYLVMCSFISAAAETVEKIDNNSIQHTKRISFRTIITQ